MLRYRDIPTHTTDLLDLTSLTVEEFTALLLPFETAFVQYMAAWTLLGKPRQARKYTTYKNCPLPTPADRLLFILVYLKQNTLQVLHGRLFGMRQSKANHWIHVLLPVLCTTLRTLGDAPCRTVEALRQRLGVEVAHLALASAELVSAESVSAESVSAESVSAESAEPPLVAPIPPPLFVMTAPSGPSRAPKMPPARKRATVARKSATC